MKAYGFFGYNWDLIRDFSFKANGSCSNFRISIDPTAWFWAC